MDEIDISGIHIDGFDKTGYRRYYVTALVILSSLSCPDRVLSLKFLPKGFYLGLKNFVIERDLLEILLGINILLIKFGMALIFSLCKFEPVLASR